MVLLVTEYINECCRSYSCSAQMILFRDYAAHECSEYVLTLNYKTLEISGIHCTFSSKTMKFRMPATKLALRSLPIAFVCSAVIMNSISESKADISSFGDALPSPSFKSKALLLNGYSLQLYKYIVTHRCF